VHVAKCSNPEGWVKGTLRNEHFGSLSLLSQQTLKLIQTISIFPVRELQIKSHRHICGYFFRSIIDPKASDKRKWFYTLLQQIISVPVLFAQNISQQIMHIYTEVAGDMIAHGTKIRDGQFFLRGVRQKQEP